MPQSKQSRLDAMAKARGYPNYAAWKAWNEKYRQPTATREKPKRNFLQRLFERIPGHPAQTLTYADRKIESAKKKQRK